MAEKLIFLSALEASGDKHCANLIKELKHKNPDLRFVGFGGEKMADAGCQLIENTANKAVMIYNVFTKLFYYIKLIKEAKQFFRNTTPDIVILCDSPAFNFHIAKAAKAQNTKTLFYVAPQLWAWAPWRIYKLKKWCDKLACILPFEEDWFRSRGVDCEFVGNPMLENLDFELKRQKRNYNKFRPETAKFLLLPGSRKAEIKSLWEPMQKIALKIQQTYPNITFCTTAADERSLKMLKNSQIPGFACKFSENSVKTAAKESDFVIAASGSVTLEIASRGCPMLVMYQSSRLLWYMVGKWLVRIKHLCLVNILAGKELVPEYMPYFSSIEPIAQDCIDLLEDQDILDYMSNHLVKISLPMAQIHSSKRVADITMDMLAG